jgi:SpoIIAA-like
MLEIIEGSADNVVAVVAKGQVSRRDYSEVLVPRSKTHSVVTGRCAAITNSGASSLEWIREQSGRTFKIGVEHIAHWERVALVTDVEWGRLAVNAFRFLVPCDVRIFGTTEAADARSRIASN